MTGLLLAAKGRPLATIALALGGQVALLAVNSGGVVLPLSQNAVPVFLIWALGAAIAPTLVLESVVSVWEARSLRLVWPYELLGWLALAGASFAVPLAVQATVPAAATVAFWLTLLAIGAATHPILGNNSWMVLVTLFCLTAFEFGQPGSVTRAALETHPGGFILPAIVLLAGAWTYRAVLRPTVTERTAP